MYKRTLDNLTLPFKRPRWRRMAVVLMLLMLFSGGLSLVEYCSSRMGIGTLDLVTHVHAAEHKYTCGMHPMIVVDEPGDCPICGMALTPLKDSGGNGGKKSGERKIKYWVAPMDPSYIRDEPGKSPMGMDLVPVYEDEATGGSIISVDPVTAQNMGVRTARVSRENLSRTIRTVGLVEYVEDRQFSVNSKIDGWIENLYVNETGQFVKKGQPLLAIYSPELVTAQEELLLAKKNHAALADSKFQSISAGAERLLEAARRRLKLWDISDRQIAHLERSGKVEKKLTLYAPYAGIVNMKMVKEGEYVKSGRELMQISDISNVWVIADIYEYELPWVRVGQPVDIFLPYADGEALQDKITYIYPYVEPKTRTVKARIELPNPGYELKPDMYVNVRVKSQPVEDVLAVPAEAVLHSGEKTTVFVALEGGKFEPRRVRTGVQGENDLIEIRDGLFEGERVVTSAQFMFDSESKLREAISKMLEPKKEEPMKQPAAEEESMDDLFEEDSPPKQDEELDDLFK